MKSLRIPLLLALAVALSLLLAGCAVTRASDQAATPAATGATAQSAGALVFPRSDLSDGAAHFYSQDVDGVTVEIIAARLPDGSIRTAFNACQVCYDSGKGYYKQEGEELVCQNCGNGFTLDQVGLSGGGCNPVPIGEADRLDGGGSVIVSREVLQKGEALFLKRGQ